MLRPGRFDVQVDIPLPEERERRDIFSVHLRGKPASPGIDATALAARTEGFSGADMAGVCQRAAMEALRRVVATAEGGSPDEASLNIELSDFDAVLADIKSDDLRRGGLTRPFA